MRPLGIPPRTGGLPAREDLRRPRVSLPAALLAFLAAIVAGAMLYSAQFSGSLRWAIGIAGLAILAAHAWRYIFRGSAEPAPLVPPTLPGPRQAGDFDRFSRAVRRASLGLPYSQVVVTSRARAAFLEHARLSLGLASEAMREAQANPDALRRLVRDDALAEFLHLQAGDLDEAYRWVYRARGRSGFAPEFSDVLNRMEAWR